MKHNPFRNISIGSLVAAAAGAASVFAPGALGIEGIEGGFAISFVGIVVAVSGIAVAIVFWRRARALDAMFSGSNLLVHWTYSPDEWQQYTEQEFLEEKSRKNLLFFVTAGIALFVGALFWIMDPEVGQYVFLTMLGLIALLRLVAYLATRRNYYGNKGRGGEAYISREGVYLGPLLHSWRGLDARLEDVAYDEESRSLLFSYSAVDRTGPLYYTVRVPVPDGQEDTAREVLAELTG